MKKAKYKAELYKIKLVKRERNLFYEYENSNDWNTLCDAIMDDFNKNNVIPFVHPKDKGKVYTRHYALPPCYGFAVLNVGLLKNEFDYAVVCVNIKSENYDPYVVLADYTRSFHSPDVLADMVERSLSWGVKVKGMKVVLEKWEIPLGERKIMWIRDCVNTYFATRRDVGENLMNDFGHEERKNKPRRRKSQDFGDYVKDGLEDKVVSWIGKEIKDMDQPIDMMRPVRAFRELKLFKKKPPITAFVVKFDKEGKIKKTSYNDYIDLSKPFYYKDDAYEDTIDRIKEEFEIE